MGIEHPDITKMNRDGFLGTADEDNIIGKCYYCGEDIRRGQKIVEFYDEMFCDTECVTEAFSEDPFKFGAEKTSVD